MNQFLIKEDFLSLIEETDLDELTNSNDDVLEDVIDESVEEVAGYIRHRYNEAIELAPVQSFSLTKEIELTDQTAYDAASTYVAGDVMYFTDYKVYKANQAVSAGETPVTDPAKWDLVAYKLYDRVYWEETAYDTTDTTYKLDDRVSYSGKIYESLINYSNYDAIAGTYNLNDKVRYNGNNYNCIQAIAVPKAWDSDDWELYAEGTFDSSDWTELGNNKSHWHILDYMIKGEDLNYPDAKEEDNRNKKLRAVTLDVALYNLFARITPRDIPEVRQIRYDGQGRKNDSENAISWLEKVQKGTVTPDMTALKDSDGDEIQNTNPVSWGTTDSSSFKY